MRVFSSSRSASLRRHIRRFAGPLETRKLLWTSTTNNERRNAEWDRRGSQDEGGHAA